MGAGTGRGLMSAIEPAVALPVIGAEQLLETAAATPFWWPIELYGVDSDVYVPLGLVAILFGASAVFLYKGRSVNRRRQKLDSTPTESPYDVTPGTVAVQGTAKPIDSAMRKPFSDDDCLYGEWEIQRIHRKGRTDSRRRTTVADGTVSTPFYVEGEDEVVRVDPDGSDLEAGNDVTSVGPGTSEPEPIREFLETADDAGMSMPSTSEGHTSVGLFGWRQWYIQRTIDPGEEVYVYGNATQAQDRGPELARYEITGGDDNGLFVVADENQNFDEREGHRLISSKSYNLFAVGAALVAVLILAAGVLSV